ncbi:heavy metal translocating P-type ATPase [Aeromicrobium stalagmiti]|uniref:heavy metal translocating P-type ATPase n=1 Tax=Aeromicrobium stalagmiti TaxID=2738988 RepID=UPI0020C3D02E|nr:cation-translocating P-type ATPase [Aeromicrobium stalagmiti]
MVSWWRDPALAFPASSGLLLAAGYIAQWSGGDSLSTALFSLALAAGGWTFAPSAVRNLFSHRFLGVGLLMTIAATGAVILGHVGEAAALAFLFSIAEGLEDRAMDRAKHGLSALLSLMPQTARISTFDGDRTVVAADVNRLDILIVGGGERVATDGVVVSGRSNLDTSAITGESIPVEVGPGDGVLAGSVNSTGTLQIEASADGTDNSLTTIVRLVQEAHERKGERARLADRIAKPLVPIVLFAAALVALLGSVFGDSSTWIERALVVLVAASPCAMAIAVPVTVISAIGSASKFGIIIKSGEAFERFGTIRQIAMDKTGTLTRNTPQVVDAEAIESMSRGELLGIAASLERASTHPLAAAVVASASDVPESSDVEEIPGCGIRGTLAGAAIRVGSPRWVDPGPLTARSEEMASAGMSLVVVERDGAPIGVIGIRDELRPEAVEAIALMRDAGIEVVMLTGDNARTAHALAAEAGISTVHADQMPEDKARIVEELSRKAPTAMIGDGVNDAPALAGATIGIAMGVGGSAAAIESADIAFTGHDLRLIPAAIQHAHRGRRIMTSNILLALAIIVVLFPLALWGILGLAGVVLVHELAEVVVIGNGARASRVRGLGGLRAEPAPDPLLETVAGEGCADGCCAPTAPPVLIAKPLPGQRPLLAVTSRDDQRSDLPKG